MFPITKEKVHIVLYGFSLDGFQPFFFKRCWDIVGNDLWHLVASVFSNGRVDLDIVETLIVLVPKGEQHVHLKKFCPISLWNVIYKVIPRFL